RDVHPVHHRGVLLREQQLLRHVVDEQRAHAVVGEDLPHLRQEQDRQARRLFQPGPRERTRRGEHVHASTSGEPHTFGGQSTWPSAYTTPGVRSRSRNSGPSRSTMSQCWPRMKAGAIARLVPTMLPTITRLPISRARLAIIKPSVRPPHLSSLMLITSNRCARSSSSARSRMLSSAAIGTTWSMPSRSASWSRRQGCSSSDTPSSTSTGNSCDKVFGT